MKHLSLFFLLAMLSTLFSCQKEDDLEVDPTPADLAAEVAGTYQGTLSFNDSLYFNYQFTVLKLTKDEISAKGEDDRFPEIASRLMEAPELAQVDWITQPNTYQWDSTFTYVRATQHLTVIRTDLGVEFFGYKQP